MASHSSPIDHCFQILSSWKFWLTGVASIVLGLFGFLGNFLAIAVLWDAFLGVNCAKQRHGRKGGRKEGRKEGRMGSGSKLLD